MARLSHCGLSETFIYHVCLQMNNHMFESGQAGT